MNSFSSRSKDSAARSVRFVQIFLFFVVCLLGFLGGIYFAFTYPDKFESNQDYAVDDQYAFEELASDTVDDIPTGAEAEYVQTSSSLDIDWIEPEKQSYGFVDQVFLDALCMSDDGSNLCEYNLIQFENVYTLGTVNGGDYDGYSLDMVTTSEESLGKNYWSFYFLYKPDEPTVLLNKHFRQTSNWLITTPSQMEYITDAITTLGDYRTRQLFGYVIETEAYVPELQGIEQVIRQYSYGQQYYLDGYWQRLYSQDAISLISASRSEDLENGKTAYLYDPPLTDDGMIVSGYTSVGRNEFYVVDVDGRVVWYDLEVPFMNYDMDSEGYIILSQGVPDIKWNDGTVNERKYMKGALGGCGFVTATNVISDDAIKTLDLVPVGTTNYYEKTLSIYEPRSYDIEYYRNAFNTVSTDFSDNGRRTYEDFDHPYVYFQDSYDRWIELADFDLIPPVECGKPVVYLYPESPVDVDVRVHPVGGLSYSEPDYGDGWSITAHPDGTVVNKNDSHTYPYLFWEGRGGQYIEPREYWVVQKQDVRDFLVSTLSEMNFTEKEIADFNEFWLPRMQDAPYYKIGFHGTSVMDTIAPLEFSVQPDHIFRVLMDFKELEKWQPSHPPKTIPKADRSGFDVVEWGGVLR